MYTRECLEVVHACVCECVCVCFNFKFALNCGLLPHSWYVVTVSPVNFDVHNFASFYLIVMQYSILHCFNLIVILKYFFFDTFSKFSIFC